MGVPCTSNRAPAPQHRGNHGLGGQLAFRRRDYGAWGETLPGGFDSVPGGMPYSFVGALGVRTDVDTGLLWMRQRWYDPTLQRFISRDQLHSKNRYDYAGGSPTVFVDVTGLEPTTPTGGEHIGGGIYKYGPHSYHNNGEGYPGSAALEAAIVAIRSRKVDCPKRDNNPINQVFEFSWDLGPTELPLPPFDLGPIPDFGPVPDSQLEPFRFKLDFKREPISDPSHRPPAPATEEQRRRRKRKVVEQLFREYSEGKEDRIRRDFSPITNPPRSRRNPLIDPPEQDIWPLGR